MSIQLLVENAVKHGISELPNGGCININVYEHKEQVAIDVINTGQLSPKESESGVGLKNLKERIGILFGSNSEIQLVNETKDSVRASIIIPA